MFTVSYVFFMQFHKQVVQKQKLQAQVLKMLEHTGQWQEERVQTHKKYGPALLKLHISDEFIKRTASNKTNLIVLVPECYFSICNNLD